MRIRELRVELCAVCRDIVRYAVAFDRLVHGVLVRPGIERIFAFRQQGLRKLIAPETAIAR